MALAVAFTAVIVTPASAEYRSKVYLDPGKKIDESVSLSIEQLEQQLGSFDDAYARSSAGRHLARHYLNNKQYDKAVEFYRKALADQGLSEIANREMQRELASVYLLKQDYPKALALLQDIRAQLPEPDDGLLLLIGQAQFKSGDYLALADTLDDLMDRLQTLSDPQLKQMLAMSWGSRNYQQSETLLKTMIDRAPEDMTLWRQLTSIYLTQNKQKAALDRLALAREKRLDFSEQDIKLLANLYMSTKAAEKGARVLSEAIGSGELEANAEHYKQSFEYWLMAREQAKATTALKQAASLSGEMELYLKLAQLYMEREKWAQMNQTILQACRDTVADKYVGRANLYLGISQLKLNDRAGARRSLINATLMGSQWQKANQWLQFMQAEPASAKEMRSIKGPCQPLDPDIRIVEDALIASVDQASVDQAGGGAQNTESEASAGDGASELNIKVVEQQRFYFTTAKLQRDTMQQQLRRLMVPLGVRLVRSGGSIDGPLHIFFKGDEIMQGESLSLSAGFPIKGAPPSKGRYKSKILKAFKCASLQYSGPADGLRAAWEQLARDALVAGYELSGQSRQILERSDNGDEISAELQLGVL
ncbi:MAG: hypothetical protein AseanaTS_30020 [Candidatus Pelagadaptatus aseana]